MRIKYHAKAIITGEYSVLTGGDAVIFPIKKYYTCLNYEGRRTNSLNIISEYNTSKLESFFAYISSKFGKINGKIILETSCPPSSGLGSSASISCCFAALLYELKMVNNIVETATKLEDFFHGRSSGADIAGCINNTSIIYNKNHICQLNSNYLPLMLLTPSNKNSQTKDLIKNFQYCKHTDKMMKEATSFTIAGFTSENIELIAKGINMAAKCFRIWGLTENIENDIEYIAHKGALAVKPTGSGSGGYILSLWNTPPPTEIMSKSILIKN